MDIGIRAGSVASSHPFIVPEVFPLRVRPCQGSRWRFEELRSAEREKFNVGGRARRMRVHQHRRAQGARRGAQH